MRIFLTGGTGFIGSHFINTAHAAGHEVVALRRPGSNSPIPLTSEPQWIEGSLADDHRDSLTECDALVHLAAAGVNPSDDDLEDLFLINVHQSLSLWTQAVHCGIRKLVLCGSCFEYGASGQRYEYIPITAPLEPTNAYGCSKAAATFAAYGLCLTREIKCSVLRPFHVFGDGEAPHRFWASLKAAALSGQDFPMTEGQQVRDFVPVKDVATSFIDELTRNDQEPGKLKLRNIGTGAPQHLCDFAQYWWKYWSASGKLFIGKESYRPNEVMRYIPEV